MSPLQKERLKYQPKLPKILQNPEKLILKEKETLSVADELAPLFPKTLSQPIVHIEVGAPLDKKPLKVGVVLSGGQAAGGHNVISGLFDALKKLHPKSRLFGFLNGPKGIIENKTKEITEEMLANYRNQGGFDLIGSGRTKIETSEQFESSEKTVKTLDLDGLVIVGGDDSNTTAALLAEYFLSHEVKTKVVGVPKTIDGDLKNERIEISFGFDTASKTYSEYIGNVLRDTLSAKKYYFFIKLMGRTASHLTLECALQTHPNLTLIGEEIESQKKTVSDITREIADMISERKGKDYGVILIPEGIIEFIPEFKVLIKELNALQAQNVPNSEIRSRLTQESLKAFNSLPKTIQEQLLLDRDPHGNVQVSKIETERLFIELVKEELKKRKDAGTYKGEFSPQPLFCGYEGRSCMPTNFDAQYCYALGYVAALLIASGATGYMSGVQNLAQPPEEWTVGGIPLVSMMTIETRKGKPKPVIKKALVDLSGKLFSHFAKERERWKVDDDYRYPGPIQFFGPQELTDNVTYTLNLRPSQQ